MKIDTDWIERWVKAVNADPACQNSGRGFHASFTLAIGAARYTLHVRDGRIERTVIDGGPLEPSTFTLSAEESVWEALFQPDPPPMQHAVFAAIASGQMSFEGDIRVLFQQMTTLSNWVLAGRALQGPSTVAADPEWHEHWQAVGRYVNVEIDGCRHKVFYFEAGQGTPLLCQHTAGNENRQWRHLLEDRELTRHYRVIAYDLPAHGKSDPSFDRDFFAEDQLLTSDWITRFVVALADALHLDRPIFMGCSIGGVIAAHLAERFPERFRALVGPAGAVPTSGFFHDWWIDPAVNVNHMVPGMMDAVMAPGLSAADRQMNRIMQGAPPRSLRNDLYFWGVENADPARADRIDASRVPLYLYAGEYDFTCPPELVEAAAERIGNVTYRKLDGLGHFPMSENYDLFRPVLMETLQDIAARHKR